MMSRIPWVTTRQFTVDLFPSWSKSEGDREWSLGSVTVDVEQINARLEKLISDLNEDQWEIKFIVPLDKSLTFHEHQKVTRKSTRREPDEVLGAFGLGWAASTTSAFIVVAQRTEWLTDAAYQAKLDERENKFGREERIKLRTAITEENAAINARISAAQQQLANIRSGDVSARKSGLLRTEKYIFDGNEFASRAEAASARSARIAELESELLALPLQLKVLPPEA